MLFILFYVLLWGDLRAAHTLRQPKNQYNTVMVWHFEGATLYFGYFFEIMAMIFVYSVKQIPCWVILFYRCHIYRLQTKLICCTVKLLVMFYLCLYMFFMLHRPQRVCFCWTSNASVCCTYHLEKRNEKFPKLHQCWPMSVQWHTLPMVSTVPYIVICIWHLAFLRMLYQVHLIAY